MIAQLAIDREPPEAILFDMDGLIFDSETLYRSIYLDLLRADGHKANEGHFAKLVGLGWKETVAVLEADYPGLNGTGFVTKWKLASHPDRGGLPDLKPGVGNLLELLESWGIAAAIATGSQREVAYGFLDHHSLRHRFAAIVAHEDAELGKPHPDPFLNAAAALGCAPDRCLVLEDSCNGLRAAAAAGIPAIFVPDMIAPNDEIRRLALAIAGDLNEVGDWLGRLRTANSP